MSAHQNAFNAAASTPPKHKPIVGVRVTPEEREQLEQDAGSLTLSAYVRLRLFGDGAPKHRTRGKKPVADDQSLARVLNQLMRSNIANNLNQIARAAHTGTLPLDDSTALYLQEARDEIAAMRADLITALGLSERSP